MNRIGLALGLAPSSDNERIRRRHHHWVSVLSVTLAVMMAAVWDVRDVWRTQWHQVLMLLACGVLLAYRPPKRLREAFVGAMIVLISCLNTWNPTTIYPVEIVRLLDIQSGRALIAFLATAGLAFAIPARWRRTAIEALCWAAMIDAGILLYRGLVLGWADGFLRNASMDATFVAMGLFPLVGRAGVLPREWMRPALYCFAASSIAAAILCTPAANSGGRSALVALGAGSVAWLWAIQPKRWGKMQRVHTLWIVGMPFLALAFFRRSLSDTTGRWDLWSLLWRAMNEHEGWNWIRGAGAGSAEVLIPTFQVTYGLTYTGFIWAHNEWLQILLEYGFLGAAAALIVYGQSVTRAWKGWRNEWLFASLGVLGVASLTQMPLRHALPAMLTALLIRDALDCLHKEGAR